MMMTININIDNTHYCRLVLIISIPNLMTLIICTTLVK